MTAGGYLRKKCADFGGKVAGGEEVGGRTDIYDVMRNTSLRCRGNFCGSNVETCVNLYGIKVEDLTAKVCREGKGKVGFPRSGGSGDG